MSKAYVYILVTDKRSNWSYVGSTTDIDARLKLHNQGKTKSTKPYRPLRIAHVETYDSVKKAYEREMFLKTGYGREEKQRLLKHSGIV